MSYKCELTRDESKKLIDLIISYGLSCRRAGYAVCTYDPVESEKALDERSQSFEKILVYLSDHWVKND